MGTDFLDSPAGRVAMHTRRWFGRVIGEIVGIEPRSKNAMSFEDKIRFQQGIASLLRSRKKRTFRGDLALQLDFSTTERNPSHLQTIAKNLLDLLGRPLAPIPGFREGLLYGDDRQIKILSVNASHGNDEPSVHLQAANLREFSLDIALASEAESDLRKPFPDDGWDESPLDRLADSIEHERLFRERFGETGFESIVFMERYEAQRFLLNKGSFPLFALRHLLGPPKERDSRPTIAQRVSASLESFVRESPVKLTLGELPVRSGDSNAYKQAVTEALTDFRNRFAWILEPLLIPVALEIVVKAAPPARRSNTNDLDNIARNFLIPTIIEQLRPPSDIGWVATVQREAGRNLEVASAWEKRSARLPRSTKIGITRYDVVEIPRTTVDESPGFVAATVVADPGGFGGIFKRVDRAIDEWKSQLRERR